MPIFRVLNCYTEMASVTEMCETQKKNKNLIFLFSLVFFLFPFLMDMRCICFVV